MKTPQKKWLRNGMRKWEEEKGPSKNFTWVPRGLNPALRAGWLDGEKFAKVMCLGGWEYCKELWVRNRTLKWTRSGIFSQSINQCWNPLTSSTAEITMLTTLLKMYR